MNFWFSSQKGESTMIVMDGKGGGAAAAIVALIILLEDMNSSIAKGATYWNISLSLSLSLLVTLIVGD